MLPHEGQRHPWGGRHIHNDVYGLLKRCGKRHFQLSNKGDYIFPLLAAQWPVIEIIRDAKKKKGGRILRSAVKRDSEKKFKGQAPSVVWPGPPRPKPILTDGSLNARLLLQDCREGDHPHNCPIAQLSLLWGCMYFNAIESICLPFRSHTDYSSPLPPLLLHLN